MQQCLWNDIEPTGLKIGEVATLLQVSSATVRNWIKIGQLQMLASGMVTKNSVDDFIKNNIGKTKLVSRANKLHKNDNYDANIFISDSESDMKTYHKYENYLSEAYRNKEGIYYTPENIVVDMLTSIAPSGKETFLEPCCGCGNFIIAAIRKGIKPENIYAFDTDKNAVEITKQRILEETGYSSDKIIHGDFLTLCSRIKLKFDYIFTNPPWGKKLSKTEKEYFAATLNAGKSNDTSSLFFFACTPLLTPNGKLGFLLPEAFSNIATFEDARRHALQFTIERLVDYNKPFHGLMTKAHAVILRNSNLESDNQVLCQNENSSFYRTQTSFATAPKHIFYFAANHETACTLEYIYSLPHITLKNNAKWALGIVTGNNNELCKTIKTEGYVPIFRGKDISPAGLEMPTLFIESSLKKCQQVAPLSMYNAKEKLIYRFISNKLVFYCDTEQRYILNSANLLILNDSFPLTGKQMTDLLNSKLMNWVFKTIFDTHKVLRSDLELLPIHYGYFANNRQFDETDYLDYLNLEEQNGTYRIKR